MQFRGRAFAQIRSADVLEDTGELVVTGIASAGGLDHKGTHINQESVWAAASKKPSLPVFWNHDWDALVGRTREMGQGDDQLIVRAVIGKDFEVPVTKGLGGVLWNVNNLRAQIQQGLMNAFSIGFNGNKEERDDGDFNFFVDDLAEVSVVNVPAHDKTLFSFQRSMILDDTFIQASRSGGNDRIDNKQNRFELIDPEDDSNIAELSVALRMLDDVIVRG